jgi:hypothetical protein
MEELERLKELVLKGGFDEESKQEVRDLETRLRKLAMTDNLASHTIIAEYIAHLRSEIARCKELLSEDEKLTESERVKLFERIKQSREFLDRFDTSQRAGLEKTIKDLLNAAISQA